MRNVYLLRLEYLKSTQPGILKTSCNRPQALQKGMYGWNVHIQSRLEKAKGNYILFIETVSQYQLQTRQNLQATYLDPALRAHFTELVYAAHCHHSALLIASASSFPDFEEYIPEFMNLKSTQKCTNDIMIAA
jgi:hypothetical protein